MYSGVKGWNVPLFSTQSRMIGRIPHIIDFDEVYVHIATTILELKAQSDGLFVSDEVGFRRPSQPAKERGVSSLHSEGLMA